MEKIKTDFKKRKIKRERFKFSSPRSQWTNIQRCIKFFLKYIYLFSHVKLRKENSLSKMDGRNE